MLPWQGWPELLIWLLALGILWYLIGQLAEELIIKSCVNLHKGYVHLARIIFVAGAFPVFWVGSQAMLITAFDTLQVIASDSFKFSMIIGLALIFTLSLGPLMFRQLKMEVLTSKIQDYWDFEYDDALNKNDCVIEKSDDLIHLAKHMGRGRIGIVVLTENNYVMSMVSRDEDVDASLDMDVALLSNWVKGIRGEKVCLVLSGVSHQNSAEQDIGCQLVKRLTKRGLQIYDMIVLEGNEYVPFSPVHCFIKYGERY